MDKTKCDIIRDVITTNEFCSICTPQTCSKSTPGPAGQRCTGLTVDTSTNLLVNYCVGTPTKCSKSNIVIDPRLCNVPKYLDAKMRLFSNKFLSFTGDEASDALASNDATLISQVQQDLVNIHLFVF